MKAFQWNACFITGLHDVDEQHHRLVDLINRFGELIMDRDGATDVSLDSVFLALADYSRYHFDDEEALMVAERLDPRDVAEHKKIHAGFLSEVIRLHAAATKDIEASRYLLQFLTHWLAYHILGTDQIMVRKIAAIRGGCDPKDVCGNLGSSQDPATDTLLAALNALFNQVSERNHQLEKLNASLEARVADRTRALTEANQRLDELANTDPLTGLHNRRYAMQRLATEWESSEAKRTPLSCLMIDADEWERDKTKRYAQLGLPERPEGFLEVLAQVGGVAIEVVGSGALPAGGARVLLGLRPEKILLSAIDAGRVQGQVRDGIWFGRTEPLPSKAQLAFRIDLNEFQGRQRVQLIVEGASEG